jgi:hypothetical protein
VEEITLQNQEEDEEEAVVSPRTEDSEDAGDGGKGGAAADMAAAEREADIGRNIIINIRPLKAPDNPLAFNIRCRYLAEFLHFCLFTTTDKR